MDILRSASEGMPVSISVIDDFSEVGGGSLPMEKIPTKCVAIEPLVGSAAFLEEGLRRFEIPVISRISKDRVFLDPRTIQEEDIEIVRDAFIHAVNKLKECN
jgi:L-seryl-tRNA(Ser) seleniumtransferase